MLCENETGIELAQLDKPILGGAEILQDWAKRYKILYLTGRPDNTRELTKSNMRKFGFPVDDVRMEMVTLQDWKDRKQLEARERLLSSLVEAFDVTLVVDDFPGYFPSYLEHGIPRRIGFLSEKYTEEDYTSKGATTVIHSWSELQSLE